MNQFQLGIRGVKEGKTVACIRPVFVWHAPDTCHQFTLEMATDSDFTNIIFLRDTRESFYPYDNVPLEADYTYYVRVRSGMGEWSVMSFTTKERD